MWVIIRRVYNEKMKFKELIKKFWEKIDEFITNGDPFVKSKLNKKK